MKNKRIAVSGGAGFIGSNLVWSLHNENDVTVIDNLSTGRIENINELIASKRVQFINGSIADSKLMMNALSGIDVVFHEAALPSVSRSVKDPLTTNEAGITGTLTTLLAARDSGVKRFVFASSSSVYGDTPMLPKNEEMSPNPISPYALTKYTCEQYCRLFKEIYGLSTVSLRYFNVFGPRQDPTSEYSAVIPRFIHSALQGKDLTIYGDGLQTRDFTFVKDIVKANILAAESDSSGTYNIAAGKQITLNDLASQILKIVGTSKANIKYQPPRVGDIKHSLADISKANRAFGYASSYSIHQGLEETVRWFSNERST
jgi:UDP-glucose 4-epimerase